MKTKSIILILVLFVYNIINCQINKVEYYTFTKNTVDTTDIKTYLLFDNNKSLFIWKSINQEIKKRKEVTNEEITKINIKKIYNDTIGKRVFNNYSSKKFILQEPLLEKNIKLIDCKLDLNWKILNEFKFIGSIKTQKAKATFRGRNYIAWFTEKYPIPSGPWKLYGLPGLILEAFDEKREVNFIFKKIYKCYNCNEKIDISVNEDIISLKEFVEKKDMLYVEKINETLTKLPRGVKVLKSSFKNRNIELTYEWEEESKEN